MASGSGLPFKEAVPFGAQPYPTEQTSSTAAYFDSVDNSNNNPFAFVATQHTCADVPQVSATYPSLVSQVNPFSSQPQQPICTDGVSDSTGDTLATTSASQSASKAPQLPSQMALAGIPTNFTNQLSSEANSLLRCRSSQSQHTDYQGIFNDSFSGSASAPVTALQYDTAKVTNQLQSLPSALTDNASQVPQFSDSDVLNEKPAIMPPPVSGSTPMPPPLDPLPFTPAVSTLTNAELPSQPSCLPLVHSYPHLATNATNAFGEEFNNQASPASEPPFSTNAWGYTATPTHEKELPPTWTEHAMNKQLVSLKEDTTDALSTEGEFLAGRDKVRQRTYSSGPTAEGEYFSSSLNQSLSSLLDSQEDITQHSPIQLLPAAPDSQPLPPASVKGPPTCTISNSSLPPSQLATQQQAAVQGTWGEKVEASVTFPGGTRPPDKVESVQMATTVNSTTYQPQQNWPPSSVSHFPPPASSTLELNNPNIPPPHSDSSTIFIHSQVAPASIPASHSTVPSTTLPSVIRPYPSSAGMLREEQEQVSYTTMAEEQQMTSMSLPASSKGPIQQPVAALTTLVGHGQPPISATLSGHLSTTTTTNAPLLADSTPSPHAATGHVQIDSNFAKTSVPGSNEVASYSPPVQSHPATSAEVPPVAFDSSVSLPPHTDIPSSAGVERPLPKPYVPNPHPPHSSSTVVATTVTSTSAQFLSNSHPAQPQWVPEPSTSADPQFHQPAVVPTTTTTTTSTTHPVPHTHQSSGPQPGLLSSAHLLHQQSAQAAAAAAHLAQMQHTPSGALPSSIPSTIPLVQSQPDASSVQTQPVSYVQLQHVPSNALSQPVPSNAHLFKQPPTLPTSHSQPISSAAHLVQPPQASSTAHYVQPHNPFTAHVQPQLVPSTVPIPSNAHLVQPQPIPSSTHLVQPLPVPSTQPQSVPSNAHLVQPISSTATAPSSAHPVQPQPVPFSTHLVQPQPSAQPGPIPFSAHPVQPQPVPSTAPVIQPGLAAMETISAHRSPDTQSSVVRPISAVTTMTMATGPVMQPGLQMPSVYSTTQSTQVTPGPQGVQQKPPPEMFPSGERNDPSLQPPPPPPPQFSHSPSIPTPDSVFSPTTVSQLLDSATPPLSTQTISSEPAPHLQVSSANTNLGTALVPSGNSTQVQPASQHVLAPPAPTSMQPSEYHAVSTEPPVSQPAESAIHSANYFRGTSQATTQPAASSPIVASSGSLPPPSTTRNQTAFVQQQPAANASFSSTATQQSSTSSSFMSVASTGANTVSVSTQDYHPATSAYAQHHTSEQPPQHPPYHVGHREEERRRHATEIHHMREKDHHYNHHNYYYHPYRYEQHHPYEDPYYDPYHHERPSSRAPYVDQYGYPHPPYEHDPYGYDHHWYHPRHPHEWDPYHYYYPNDPSGYGKHHGYGPEWAGGYDQGYPEPHREVEGPHAHEGHRLAREEHKEQQQRYAEEEEYSSAHGHHDVSSYPDQSTILGVQSAFEENGTFVNSPYNAHNRPPQPQPQSYVDTHPAYPNSAYGQNGEDEGQPPTTWEEQPRTEPQEPPPPPLRKTPELFAHPHVRASFAPGGALVVVLPHNLRAFQRAEVDLLHLRDVIQGSELTGFVEAVDAFPGPLMPGETPKSVAVSYASGKAEQCRTRQAELPGEEGDRAEAGEELGDEALLWNFLELLCQQNGVVVTSDVSELLTKGSTSIALSRTHVGVGDQEEALESIRQLLISGRKKNALELACGRCLWGHALMLASGMDEQSRTYVINRFTASLATTDPLSTFYTLMLGRTPSAVKPDGLQRAGSWKPHLAMILANRSCKLDNASIVALGESLMSRGRLHAAHLCYHLGEVNFSAYGSAAPKYQLLGVNNECLKPGLFPRPEYMRMMEVFEFAMNLGKHDFVLPHFQVFKYLLALKLTEAGVIGKAFKYCEQIAMFVSRSPGKFPVTLLQVLSDLSTRLHHLNHPYGVVEIELPSWLLQLQQTVSSILSGNYTPSARNTPSPSFSSVSQAYAQAGQPGLKPGNHFLRVPGLAYRGNGGETSSATSSKEGSMIALAPPLSLASQQEPVDYRPPQELSEVQSNQFPLECATSMSSSSQFPVVNAPPCDTATATTNTNVEPMYGQHHGSHFDSGYANTNADATAVQPTPPSTFLPSSSQGALNSTAPGGFNQPNSSSISQTQQQHEPQPTESSQPPQPFFQPPAEEVNSSTMYQQQVGPYGYEQQWTPQPVADSGAYGEGHWEQHNSVQQNDFRDPFHGDGGGGGGGSEERTPTESVGQSDSVMASERSSRAAEREEREKSSSSSKEEKRSKGINYLSVRLLKYVFTCMYMYLYMF